MNLQIDYSQVRTLASNVKDKAGEFSTLLTKITSSNESLKSSWKGSDAEKYTSAVTEQSNVMKELQKSLDQIGDFLNNVANVYEKVEETNKQGINMN